MNIQIRNRILSHFFFLSYFGVLALGLGYWPAGGFKQFDVNGFVLVVHLTYAFIYILPALLLTKGLHRLVCLVAKEKAVHRWVTVSSYSVAVLMVGLTLVLLVADRQIYEIYDFHINGFVINLFTTPGGIESMGMSGSSTMVFGLIICALFVGTALILWVAHALTLRRTGRPLLWKYRYLVFLFIFMTCGERIAYGVSHYSGYSPVTVAAGRFPLYQPLTFRSLAKRIGLKPMSESAGRVKTEVTRLEYPLSTLKIKPPEIPFNVIWLVSESLRADMLDPEIMPATWDFSSKAHRFTQHYSGGNGTRMGLFSLFYGLYSNFWFPVLESSRGPVLFDVLRQLDYQWRFFSSQRLSYPEFDRTLFASIPREDLQSYIEGHGWKRDRKNMTDMLEFLEQRDPERPFVSYMFFESPHARYYFPEESVIRRPYLENFNYATMDLAQDMPQIKNRYINSVHHLDSQFARLFAFLEKEHLLENTIVLVTGDHGEEFDEYGHWGHGSSFNDSQTRVPMVLWIPGTGRGTVDHMTSHLDVVPTLLPRLGVQNPVSDYALGYDMLGPPQRQYTVAGHWRTLCFISKQYKATFAMGNAQVGNNNVTCADNQLCEDPGAFYDEHQSDLVEVMQDIARFSKK